MPVIYALKDPATGEVRYIGKANNLVDRLRCHKFERDNPKFQTRKARWLRTLETAPVAEVLEIVAPEHDWAERERSWIRYYREQGARLTNYTDGGEGWPNSKGHTEAAKAKMRATALAQGSRPPSRAGTVPWNKGSKGVLKPNRGTFQKGRKPHNKGRRATQCAQGHERAIYGYYRDGRYRNCKECQRIRAVGAHKGDD